MSSFATRNSCRRTVSSWAHVSLSRRFKDPYAPERLLQMALTLRVRLATDGIPCAAPVLPHGPRGTLRLEDIHAE